MISLQFSYSLGIADEAIKWYEHGEWAHVDVIMPSGDLLGARMDGGVQARPFNYYKFTKTKRVDLYAEVAVTNSFQAWLQQQIGKPYDTDAIIGFAVERNWRDPCAWFCSELIAAGLEHAHWFPTLLYAPANKITPADLILALSARNYISEDTRE